MFVQFYYILLQLSYLTKFVNQISIAWTQKYHYKDMASSYICHVLDYELHVNEYTVCFWKTWHNFRSMFYAQKQPKKSL
jgi:hypothetical protein